MVGELEGALEIGIESRRGDSVVAAIDTLGGRNTRPQRPPEVRIGQCRPGGWRPGAGGGRGRDPGLAPTRLLKSAHGVRSAAHTSELQSPMRISSPAFCLKTNR